MPVDPRNGSVILCPICKILISVFPIRCICGFHEIKQLITLEEYFKGKEPPSPEMRSNAEDLLLKVNSLLQELGIEKAIVTSGFRWPEDTERLRKLGYQAASKSQHLQARAIDLADDGKVISSKILTNLDLLKKRGMAMENPDYCLRANGNRWTHLQSVLPASGNTVFVPYAGPIIIS